MPKTARSFADDLRNRSDSELAALMMARPDLARPAPTDITSLAARAGTRASVKRALERLDTHQLHLLEAILVGGTDSAPGLLETTKRAVTEGVKDLWARGLLWRASDGWTPVKAVTDILKAPATLGPPARELGLLATELALTEHTSDEERIAIEAALSPRAQAVIERLRWSYPRVNLSASTMRPVLTELVEAGLMVAVNEHDGVIPREIGLGLRGGKLFEHGWNEPALDIAHVQQNRIDSAAASAILDVLWRIDEIATTWDDEAPRVLRSGGLSVKDHRVAASAMDATSELAAFIIELSYAAGLIAPDGELDAAWRPTEFYDEWSTWSRERRWCTLALAWRDMVRAPHLAGHKIDDHLVNVLGKDGAWPLMRSRRREVIGILFDLPAGSAPTLENLETLLRWRHPLALGPGAPTHADVVLREADWIGLTSHNALTTGGRAVWPVAALHDSAASTDQMEEAVAAVAAALPPQVSQIMVQADLTAIAPGPLTEDAASFMQLAADIESRGGATVFRFSQGSIRRLLDSGVSAADALERLRDMSLTPIPQALEYLISDVARSHGGLRVGAISSYVRSDDEAALNILMSAPELAALQLRRIAPTVLVSPAPARTVIETLRAHRHSPVAETSDGGVVVQTSRPPRSRTPMSSAANSLHVSVLEDAEALNLAAQLRRAEAQAVRPSAADGRTRIPSTDPTVTLALLAEAAADRVAVHIGYVDGRGEIKRGQFLPVSVDGGRVTGHLGADARTTLTLSIHRITGVAPL